MDRIPGAGGPPGADGAFERFLTAAIATIITIMFSWRLLAEEEEANARGDGIPPLLRPGAQYRQPNPGYQYGRFDPLKPRPQSPIGSNLAMTEIDISDSEESGVGFSPDSDVGENIVSEMFESQTNAELNASPPSVQVNENVSQDSQVDETGSQDMLTSWDEYKWEEELGQEDRHVIKTRRSVRDFVKSSPLDLKSSPNHSPDTLDLDSIDAVANANSGNPSESAKSPVVPFTQRFANFEYKDTGGDSGYVDLYPDSDTSDSSDDENVYDIQVSDSDSDSGDDRTGAFFGVTALDTIMEEYESDQSEAFERGEGGPGGGVREPRVGYGDIDRGNEFDEELKCAMRALDEIDDLDSSATPEICETTMTDIHVEQNLNMLDARVDKTFTPEQTVAVIERSDAETVECNLLPERTRTVESLYTQQAVSDDLHKCELSVNNTPTVKEGISITDRNNKCEVTTSDLNFNQPGNGSDLTNTVKMTVPLARPTLSDYNISEISDDSSPSSPVRTSALDNLTGDNYSDTESCSSESVITVLSVRSNDSDNFTGERYDVTGNGPSGKLGHRQNVAPGGGKNDQSLDDYILSNKSGSLYENNSLVSGFLNDSLNSLLSGANGDSDTESEGEYDNLKTDSLGPDQTPTNLIKISDIDSVEYADTGLNGRKLENEYKASISPEESINPEISQPQSCEAVSGPGEISERHIPDNENEALDQLDGICFDEQTQSTLPNDFNYSDNSSDSSDPPLREYDPDDDDLAAFQFNEDDCDNDSFYLLVGNEGSLRNFETFTNLNSLELSPEYGDAVPSHATSEDARGFKFSYTEEINTDFKKRSYFTDRNISSDSDARSDDPLSPITSEDEELVATENDKNEKFLNADPDFKTATASPYDDAVLSIPIIDTSDVNNPQNTDKRSIDFFKYIIQPESSSQSEIVPDQGHKIRSQNGNKDISGIDEDSGTYRCDIDLPGVVSGSRGASGINNKSGESGEDETFSSLTEKIQGLSHGNDSDSSENDKTIPRSEHTDICDNDDSKQLKIEQDAEIESEISTELSNNELSNVDTPIVRGAKTHVHRETQIDDIFVESKPESQETLEFDINCSGGRVTDIDEEFSSKSVPKLNASREYDTPPDKKSRANTVKIETNIDDIFVKETDFNTEIKPLSNCAKVTPTRSTVETNIDDLFDDSASKSDANSRSSIKRETSIDDIFDEVEPRVSPKSPVIDKIETNIDDIFEQAKNDLELSNKTETNIDDICVRSSDNDSNISYETFVDDLIQPVSPSSQTQCVPRDFTSDSAIDRYFPSAYREETAETAETQPAARGHQIRSDYQVTNRQSTSAKPQFEQIDVCTSDNSDLKDKSNDIEDKISDTPCVENSLDLNAVSKNNERKSNTVITPTSDNAQLLHASLESPLSRGTPHSKLETVLKSQYLNNDTNNNSELGLDPDINNEDKCTQDRSQLTHNAPCGKLPDNTRDIDELKLAATACGIELNIIEDDQRSEKSENDYSDISDNLSSFGSSSFVSDDERYHSVDENLLYQYAKQRDRGRSESSISRVVRSPLTKPSELFARSKDLGIGVRRKVHKHHLKKYTSILQQPITAERSVSPVVTTPEKPLSTSRLHVLQSRQRFLSADNLSGSSYEDKFLQHRTSLVTSTPRKYLKRHERHLTELQSTESLPSDMSHVSMLNSSYDSYTDTGKMHSLPSPRNIRELYASRDSSANSSFDRPDHHRLHANCMFSPEKRAEINHTTKSLENMFEQLLRYGSVSSIAAETDLDADPASQNQTLPEGIDLSNYVSFQCSLERAASMSAISGSSESQRLPRKPGKGRFAKRSVQKSKSLQTLETNLDDVFADENELAGGPLKKAPSVHELRVSKSLSKLNVPSWFSRSSFSRSDSTQSLFTYAGRLGSTSTLGSYAAYTPSIPSSPAPTPTSGTVIIQKRVTPSPTTPHSAKLLRAPCLPTTPERSPIHPTSLPSDKYRKNEKKDLKPIPIIPFSKLRAMFEIGGSQKPQAKTVSPVTSPTKDKPKVTFEKLSPTKDSNPTLARKETTIDSNVHEEPVQNRNVSKSPTPAVPERRPILTDSTRRSESASQANAPPRRTQVHFSDEENVSKPQEQKSNAVQQNGTSSKPKSTVKKSGFSLPMPQFRFRRPGAFATKAAPVPSSETETPKSKKGKENGFHNNPDFTDLVACDSCTPMSCPPWLHALELNAKTDGETLFEFLQKRRYSSILENGFAEQLDELQDRDGRFNFPVLTLGKHSNGITPVDGSPDLRVAPTDASSHRAHKDFVNNKLRGETSMDDILDGLLLLDGYRTGRMRMDENGRIVPKKLEDGAYSPDTPPGLALNHNTQMCKNNYDVLCVESDVDVDYVLVKCEFPPCHRETNLKEAKKCYKTCHSCFTYYCSRACRKNDWDSHKKMCIYSRINSACKHVIKCINRMPHLQYQCSRIARRGYLAQGRGAVIFAFPDIGSADDFLCYGMASLWVQPVYVALKDLASANMLGSKLDILSETCQQYNPELKYVIHVAVVIPPQLPSRPVPRRMDGIIQKCAKLRLSPAHMHPKQDNSDIPTTLILTAVPGNQHSDEQDGRKTRELCFINIQRKLRNRGVSLRHKFPEVYNRLIDFVSDAKYFSPHIIYPTDGRTGRKFMCVIMPESEPEIEWISDPDLFHELDVFDDEEEDISTPNLSLCYQEGQEEILL